MCEKINANGINEDVKRSLQVLDLLRCSKSIFWARRPGGGGAFLGETPEIPKQRRFGGNKSWLRCGAEQRGWGRELLSSGCFQLCPAAPPSPSPEQIPLLPLPAHLHRGFLLLPAPPDRGGRGCWVLWVTWNRKRTPGNEPSNANSVGSVDFIP